MLRNESSQRRRGDQRHIATSDQDVSAEVARKNYDRATRRVARAALLALDRETQIRAAICIARCRFDLARLMTHDHDQRIGTERSDRAQHPRDHRLTTDFVQYLRALRSHPGAKP